jgi:DNA-binding transcriptional MerR regulator
MSRRSANGMLKIGELARQSGLAPSRIRFYDANGLFGAVRRRVNGYREFAPATLELLTLITCAQSAGFSLEEIRSLLPTTNGHRDELVLARLRAKVVELEALMKRLAATRKGVLAVIDAIANRPPKLDCAGKMARVMAQLPPAASPRKRLSTRGRHGGSGPPASRA